MKLLWHCSIWLLGKGRRDQAMYFFHASPAGFRKIFVVLKDISNKRNETLCDYYIRTKNHLLPKDVEIWEYDESENSAERKKI